MRSIKTATTNARPGDLIRLVACKFYREGQVVLKWYSALRRMHMRTNLKLAGGNARSTDRETQDSSRGGFVSSPSGVPFSECRRNPRCSFIAAVSVLEPSSGAHIKAHTTDLSPSGCYIDTMNSFAPGTKVQLRITKGGKSVEADAVVACSQVGVGMGLTLTTIAPGHRAVLDRWFAELRGDVSPAPSTLDAVKDGRASSTLKTESDYALEELLVILMRKGLMTEEEGEPILRRLLR